MPSNSQIKSTAKTPKTAVRNCQESTGAVGAKTIPSDNTSMAFYRIMSRQEVESLVQSGFVPRNPRAWVDFPPGSIICLFEADDFTATFNRFGAVIGELRNLRPDDRLYVLQFFDLIPAQIRPDTTAEGWPLSRVYLDPVPITNVRVVASMRLAGTGPDFLRPGPIDSFNPARSPVEVLT